MQGRECRKGRNSSVPEKEPNLMRVLAERTNGKRKTLGDTVDAVNPRGQGGRE